MWFKDDRKKISRLEKKIEELEDKRDGLEDERHTLKAEVSDLKSQRKVEEEQMRHMVKIKEEKDAVKMEKYKLEEERKTQEAIGKIKDNYQDKQIELLQTQAEKTQQIYSEIMKRLPDVNLRLKGDV